MWTAIQFNKNRSWAVFRRKRLPLSVEPKIRH